MNSFLAPSGVIGRLLPLAFCIAGVFPAAAGATGTAALAVSIEANGRAQVHVMVAALVTNPPAFTSAVTRMVGRELEDVDLDIEEFKKMATLGADTATAYPHSLFQIRGALDLQPLVEFLRPLDTATLSIRLTHPRTPESHCRAGKRTFSWPAVEYDDAVTLTKAALPRIEFEFGYSARDVLRIAGPLLLILLAPLGLTLRRRGTRTAAGTEAGVLDFRSFLERSLRTGLLLWIVWMAAVYGLAGDELTWFVLGCDSLESQIAAVVGVFVVPPLLVVMLGAVLGAGGGQTAGAATPRASAARVRVGWPLVLRTVFSQLRFLAPAAFAAVGIAYYREGFSAKADEWFGVAALAVVAGWAMIAWVNAGTRGGRPNHGQSLQFQASQRRAILQRESLALALTVLAPAVVVGLGQRYRLEDTPRMVAYALGLTATLLLVRFTNWFLGRRRFGPPPPTGTAPAPPFRARTAAAVLLPPAVVAATAWIACELFDFSFVLTRGDEGWALVLMSVSVALLQTLPRLLHPRTGQAP
ncbi:MAG: hypothetical protein KGS61_07205 [Verrucomicrobia bacterium]|nr:hypothetical protein [Verrucomicrobiota bacterium]